MKPLITGLLAIIVGLGFFLGEYPKAGFIILLAGGLLFVYGIYVIFKTRK